MNFVSLTYDSRGWLGAGRGALPCFVRGNKALVYDSPKRGHGLGFGVKEILKKSNGVQRLRIGVRFTLLASFRHPVVRFGRVHDFK